MGVKIKTYTEDIERRFEVVSSCGPSFEHEKIKKFQKLLVHKH